MSNPLDPLSESVKPLSEVYLKIHDSLEGWNSPAMIANQISPLAEKAVDLLHQVPGMTQAHSRDFKRATPVFNLRDGSVLKTWKNPAGVDHVFIANAHGMMVFGGFVGWVHARGLQQCIAKIRQDFT
jgi:hypothetical protein